MRNIMLSELFKTFFVHSLTENVTKKINSFLEF